MLDGHVTFPGVLLAEALLTSGTYVRLLSSVDSEVPLNVELALENLRT